MKAIRFNNISKKFGEFYANRGITFSVEKNTIHSILGENGAGKTTLMNILFGIYKPDSGNIFLFDREVSFKTPLDAIKNKIGMVHQHFMLIDDFTVEENIILGNELIKNFQIDFENSALVINELIEKYNLNIKPDQKISELSISQQQKVEILKMLYRDSEIIIFDEPTSVLSPVEVSELFRITEKFICEGKTIIFITHKLKEVLEISDCVTVLSKGKVTYENNLNENKVNIEELSRAITGTSDNGQIIEKSITENEGKEILTLNNLTFEKNGVKKLDNFNLVLKSGEIFGICGVEGNGQNELVEIIMGFENDFSGVKRLNASSVSLVPDDRSKKGIIKEFGIGENILLKSKNKKFVTNKYLNEISGIIADKYDVRLPSLNSTVGRLSGGNQQKVIFARETEIESELFILMHPTRGVDIKATDFIHGMIFEQKKKQKAILLITSDLDELIKLSDRIGVIYNGKLIRIFETEELNNYLQNDSAMPEVSESSNELTDLLGKYMIGISDE